MPFATESSRYRTASSERESLVLSHLSLVRHVLGRLAAHFPAGIDTENLEAAGILGLVDAANKFDPSRNIKFKSYAYIRIRGAMLDELRRNCPLPQVLLERVGKIRSLLDKADSTPTLEQLAEATGLTVEEVNDSLCAMRLLRMMSLDSAEDYPESRQDPPEATLARRERKRQLAEGIAKLPERERLIVTLYYLEDLRLKEIGQVVGLSESRVSRLLSGALLKLREFLPPEEE